MISSINRERLLKPWRRCATNSQVATRWIFSTNRSNNWSPTVPTTRHPVIRIQPVFCAVSSVINPIEKHKTRPGWHWSFPAYRCDRVQVSQSQEPAKIMAMRQRHYPTVNSRGYWKTKWKQYNLEYMRQFHGTSWNHILLIFIDFSISMFDDEMEIQ